jgi:hypothetical protein
MFELAILFEIDLEAEYPGTNITVIPALVLLHDTNITVFHVYFLVPETNSTNSILPALTELEAMMVDGGFEGTVIFSEVEITLPDDDDDDEVADDAGSTKLDAKLLVLAAVALAVVIAAVGLACRKKGRVKRVYNMPT